MSRSERLMLSFVPVLFAIEVAVLAYKGALPPPWFILFVGLAAYRGGRAVSYNTIFLPLRDLVGIIAKPDTSGAGDSTEIREDVHGIRRIAAELILCPICSGQWVAMACLALYGAYPDLGSVFTYALAASGIGELAHWFAENQEWAGRNNREMAGTQWLDKNERAEVPAHAISPPIELQGGLMLEDLEDLEFYLGLVRTELLERRQITKDHAERVHTTQ